MRRSTPASFGHGAGVTPSSLFPVQSWIRVCAQWFPPLASLRLSSFFPHHFFMSSSASPPMIVAVPTRKAARVLSSCPSTFLPLFPSPPVPRVRRTLRHIETWTPHKRVEPSSPPAYSSPMNAEDPESKKALWVCAQPQGQ